MNIFRGNDGISDVPKLREEIVQNKCDVLILRLPSKTKASHSLLHQLGFQIIHADSLVYYSVNFNRMIIKPLRNELKFEIIDETNSNFLDKMIPTIFNDYQNHYYSNPIFSSKDINEGYLEWAKSFQSYEGRISWIVKNTENHGVAFATCSFDLFNKTCEGVLFGVMPNYAGIGIYSDLIRYTRNYFYNLGIKKMIVSTQLQNYSVQKSWISEGFQLKTSYETYHINSLLSLNKNDTI
jgi:GNAT superfamily N-acetyltransferase